VLTGDKIETAINIGFSCGLLNNDTYQHKIDETRTNKIIDQISDAEAFLLKHDKLPNALIIAGDSLHIITKPKNKEILEKFIEISLKMKVVIAC
jgi:magnesium-transporting ATPase (P-type)